MGVSVYLIEDNVYRLVAGTYVAKCLLHYFHLFLEVRSADVYYVKQNISLAHLVQGTLERFNELGRELSYETYRKVCSPRIRRIWPEDS